MGALHGPSILQAIEGKDVQQPPLPEGELSIISFFSAINSDESGKSEGMNMCLIGGAPRPGEFVVNHREQWGGSLGGGSLMPSLPVPLA